MDWSLYLRQGGSCLQGAGLNGHFVSLWEHRTLLFPFMATQSAAPGEYAIPGELLIGPDMAGSQHAIEKDTQDQHCTINAAAHDVSTPIGDTQSWGVQAQSCSAHYDGPLCNLLRTALLRMLSHE